MSDPNGRSARHGRALEQPGARNTSTLDQLIIASYYGVRRLMNRARLTRRGQRGATDRTGFLTVVTAWRGRAWRCQQLGGNSESSWPDTANMETGGLFQN